MKIKLQNVRLIFPSVFTKATFEGEEGKFQGTFLISKDDSKTHQEILKAIETAKKEYKDPSIKIKDTMIFIKDGDDEENEVFNGHWVVKASNKTRPTVLDRDKSQLDESDGKIYSGVYVNAIISPWVQDNKYGKRVNATLLGIQFVKDGERIGGSQTASVDDFDDIEDDFEDEI